MVKLFRKTQLAAGLFLVSSEAFSLSTSLLDPVRRNALLQLQKNEEMYHGKNVAQAAAALVFGAGLVGATIFPGSAMADEIGREREAPTLFTGETVEVSNILINCNQRYVFTEFPITSYNRTYQNIISSQ